MTRPIHVCILTTAHPVDDVRLKRKIVDSLLVEGFRVTWVGPAYHYVAPDRAVPSGPSCEFRLYAPPRRRLGRLFGRAARRVARAVPDVDVYFAPEPDSARLALSLAKRNGARVVFDIHELYHDAHIRYWAPAPLRPLGSYVVRRLIANVARRCDLTLGVSEGVLAPYLRAARQAMVVRNCAPLWFAAAAKRGAPSPNGARKHFRVMHGKSTTYNNTPTVLRALALAAPRVPDLRAVMFEWFERPDDAARHALREEIERLALSGVVELHPPVRVDEMPAILGSCQVGMISHGRFLAAGTQPNRLYEYMAAGLPVVGPAYDRGIAPVIDAEHCGVLVDAERAESIADAIVALHDDEANRRSMGSRARSAFLVRHNWEVEFRPVVDMLRRWALRGTDDRA